MKWNVLVLAVALVLSGVLSGCSLSIIHPPSAAAFMEKGDGDLQMNLTVSRVVRVENSDKDYMLKPYDKVKTSPLAEYSGENKPAFRNGGNRQTGIQETALAA